MSDEHAIVVEGLEKSYGTVRALNGVDFAARTGTVLGLLGPNGAGKTTAVRILATLLKPDAGTARVAGWTSSRRVGAAHEDRARRPVRGRRREPDRLREPRDGRPALPPAARRGAQRARRAARALRPRRGRRPPRQDVLGRHAAAARPRRRARLPPAGAVPRRAHHRPRPARAAEHVGDDRGPHGRGHDRAADDPVPGRGRSPRGPDRRDRPRQRDRGGNVRRAQGPGRRRTPRGQLEHPEDAERAIEALAEMAAERPALEDGVVRAPVRQRSGAIAEAVRRLDTADVGIDDITLRRPTLDDVFIALTGHAAEEETGAEEVADEPHARRHVGARPPQPEADPAPAGPADRVHDPARHVRAAVRVRVRRRDPNAGLRLRRLPDAGHHRPVDRVRRVRDRARASPRTCTRA